MPSCLRSLLSPSHRLLCFLSDAREESKPRAMAKSADCFARVDDHSTIAEWTTLHLSMIQRGNVTRADVLHDRCAVDELRATEGCQRRGARLAELACASPTIAPLARR